jgi:FkbM family methyltransferase
MQRSKFVDASALKDCNCYAGENCGPVQVRLADHNSKSEPRWGDFGALDKALNGLDHNQQPVVLLALRNLPCATGCCTVNVHVRPDATDRFVVEQVLANGEYNFLRELDNFQPATIMDAGANVGMATIQFALNYPHATIVAIEPDALNFQLLEMNTRRFGNVIRENKGLWSRHTGLKVKRFGETTREGDWSFEVKEVTARQQHDVKATTIDLLMAKHEIDRFDILKFDIEGSEKVVFDNYLNPRTGELREWVRTSQIVVAEVHDDIAPGALASVTKAMAATSKHQGQYFMSGELHIWTAPDVHLPAGLGSV